MDRSHKYMPPAPLQQNCPALRVSRRVHNLKKKVINKRQYKFIDTTLHQKDTMNASKIRGHRNSSKKRCALKNQPQGVDNTTSPGIFLRFK
jgi:hypothetical protein